MSLNNAQSNTYSFTISMPVHQQMKVLAVVLPITYGTRLSVVMRTWSVILLESDTARDHILRVCSLQALLGTVVLGWFPRSKTWGEFLVYMTYWEHALQKKVYKRREMGQNCNGERVKQDAVLGKASYRLTSGTPRLNHNRLTFLSQGGQSFAPSHYSSTGWMTVISHA